MAFSEQGALKGSETQPAVCLHLRWARLSIADYSQHGRGCHGTGVMCGFSAVVPTLESLQGFSLACHCPKQQGKRQDEDEQRNAVELGVLQR